jgi:hypothetical protein
MPSRGSCAGIRITNNNGRLGARCCLTSRYQQAIGSRHSGNPGSYTLTRLRFALGDRHIAKACSSTYGRALCLARASTDSAHANRADVNHLEAT